MKKHLKNALRNAHNAMIFLSIVQPILFVILLSSSSDRLWQTSKCRFEG